MRRQPDLGVYERRVINDVLDAGLVGHLGVLDGDQPYVLPLGYARNGDSVLLHGSTASRAFVRAAAGVPVCLTVTVLDGLVFARSVFNSSMNYRCVVVLGVAEPVPDEEKVEALRLLSDRLAPGHWDTVRQPSAKELKATLVLALPLAEASAKVSAGPPGDDREDLTLPVWAGVVPVRLEAGAPEPAPELEPDRAVPDYVARWVPEGR